MDRYTMREHYQKQMDAIADRFHKQIGLTVLIFAGITWGVLNSHAAFKPSMPMYGAILIIFMFIVMMIVLNGASKATKAVQEAFETDYLQNFEAAPRLTLTGLFAS